MALTNQIRYILIKDPDSARGLGMIGVGFASVQAAYVIDGGTLVSLTAETITTLGTYQAPTSAAHIRIKELNDSTPNTEGIYEIHFHNTQLATGSKLWLFLSTDDGATVPIQPLEVDLSNNPGGIAEAILKYDWTSITGEAARSVLNALRLLRNKWSVAAGTLTVTEEDDTTSAWTATVTSDNAAEPITGIDP